MTPPRRRDLRLLLLAVLLLAVPAIWFAWSSRDARERRETTLAGVPEFPAPHQAPRHRPVSGQVRAAAAAKGAAQVAPAAPVAPRSDRITSFVLASPGEPVALVHVNALFNTPLFDKLRECMPGEFQELEKSSDKLGFDVTRDLDQVAMIANGMAMSGFFDGKPVARTLLGPGAREDRTYRGETILAAGRNCAVQMGNLLLLGPTNQCEAMIDRALTPPGGDAAEEVYGDLFFRTELHDLPAAEDSPQLQALLQALQGVTVRANVWDSVALTLEGAPRGNDARDLAQMARGAISVFKGQLDDDDVELSALADLAEVSSQGGKLEVNLALPAKDLWDKLHFPCAGRDGG